MKGDPTNGAFEWFLVLEAAFIVLYALFTTYAESADTEQGGTNAHVTEFYAMYQDVHVMIFIGFGFHMAFLRRYGYGAVGLTFLLACVAIQWSILALGFWRCIFDGSYARIRLDVEKLIRADYAAAAVMISFGAVIGKLSPSQLVIMTVMEIALYALNETILSTQLVVVDVGGSMIIHTFGAFFGLGCAWAIRQPRHTTRAKDNASTYHSNLFSLIGTLFLWLFWPSFNAAVAGSNANCRHRAVINTVLAISTSCIVTFFASNRLRGRLFEIVDIQNATLAGGVAIAASASMRISPWAAMVVGLVAGCLSTGGFARLQPRLSKTIGLYDTCGVHNLHALPGLLGGVVSAIFAALAYQDTYGSDLLTVFPKRDVRSPTWQAAYQMFGLACSIGIGALGGMATGGLLLCMRGVDPLFTDAAHWLVPEFEIPNFFTDIASVSIEEPKHYYPKAHVDESPEAAYLFHIDQPVAEARLSRQLDRQAVPGRSSQSQYPAYNMEPMASRPSQQYVHPPAQPARLSRSSQQYEPATPRERIPSQQYNEPSFAPARERRPSQQMIEPFGEQRSQVRGSTHQGDAWPPRQQIGDSGQVNAVPPWTSRQANPPTPEPKRVSWQQGAGQGGGHPSGALRAGHQGWSEDYPGHEEIWGVPRSLEAEEIMGSRQSLAAELGRKGPARPSGSGGEGGPRAGGAQAKQAGGEDGSVEREAPPASSLTSSAGRAPAASGPVRTNLVDDDEFAAARQHFAQTAIY